MIPPPMPFWMRHTASVPKGFVRYRVLQLLAERAMSGSEIIEVIDKETSGQWKPSPGSIYPLLTWLKENGHIEDVKSDNPHLKRYQITESGKALTKRQEPLKAKFQGGPGLFPSSFFMGTSISGEQQEQFRKEFQRIFKALFELRNTVGENVQPFHVQGFLKILKNMVKQIEKFNKRIIAERETKIESD